MAEELDSLYTIPADAVPAELREWLQRMNAQATMASLEILPDGQMVIQAIPDLDPQFVARVRQTLGRYEDVLRRLT